MAKIIVRWEIDKGVTAQAREAHFFLYREGESDPHDHRTYSREELIRRAATIAAAAEDVPIYYEQAIKALADDESPQTGDIQLDETNY